MPPRKQRKRRNPSDPPDNPNHPPTTPARPHDTRPHDAHNPPGYGPDPTSYTQRGQAGGPSGLAPVYELDPGFPSIGGSASGPGARGPGAISTAFYYRYGNLPPVQHRPSGFEAGAPLRIPRPGDFGYQAQPYDPPQREQSQRNRSQTSGFMSGQGPHELYDNPPPPPPYKPNPMPPPPKSGPSRPVPPGPYTDTTQSRHTGRASAAPLSQIMTTTADSNIIPKQNAPSGRGIPGLQPKAGQKHQRTSPPEPPPFDKRRFPSDFPRKKSSTDWSKEEDNMLIQLKSENKYTFKQISEILLRELNSKRTPDSCSMHWYSLGRQGRR